MTWPTPLAETVQDRTVLRSQRPLHDLELQSCVFRGVVNTINRELVGTKGTSIVPGVVVRNRRLVCAAAVDLADSIESRIAIACETVVDPFRRREAIVILAACLSMLVQ